MEIPSSINQQEITLQLARILASPIFKNSGLLTGFLTFIVNEYLEGRSHLLKEYTIGTQVFSKKSRYDTREDASVRVHAGRLRNALKAYYSHAGKHDVLMISIPKGGYVPTFSINIPSVSNEATVEISDFFKPSLAILPFSFHDQELDIALADGLCDQLCTEFTSFDDLAVISYYSSRIISSSTSDIRKAALLLDANYFLTGSIRSIGNSVRISVQLMISRTFRQIWAFNYEKERSELDTFAIQDDIVNHVVNQIAGSHGIIIRETAKKASVNKISDIKVYNAVHWFYMLVNDLNEDLFLKGLLSMRESVEIDPKYSTGWAILAETYVAGNFYQYDCLIPDPLHEAIRCGKKALEIDPQCGHAFQSLCLAYLFLHQQKDCLLMAEHWIKLESKSAVVAGGVGFCLICSGEFERGYLLICNSIKINPYYPWWFNAGISIYHFHKKEYSEVIYWAEKIYHSKHWELILKTATYSEMDNHKEARLCFAELKSILPDGADLTEIIGSFLQVTELTNRLEKAINALEPAVKT